MYPTVSIANYFIEKALDSGEDVTPMKLIKLVYIAHGWYLANTDEPLIGEAVQAWKFGPVIESLYQRLKKYGKNTVTRLETVFSKDGQVIPNVTDSNIESFLDQIWDLYGRYDGLQLSALTHQQGTPWHETWVKKGGDLRNGSTIPNKLITDHYKAKLLNAAG